MGVLFTPEVLTVVIAAILGGSGWLIKRHIESRDNSAGSKAKADDGSAPSIQAGRDRLRLRLEGSPEPHVSLCVVTFRRREPSSPANRWMKDQTFSVEADASGTYYLHLLDIEKRLRDPGFPFKAYISVPVSRRHEYYGRLADAEATVTGRGEKDEAQPGNWRIWFLFPGALLHPDVEDLFRLNMKCDGAQSS